MIAASCADHQMVAERNTGVLGAGMGVPCPDRGVLGPWGGVPWVGLWSWRWPGRAWGGGACWRRCGGVACVSGLGVVVVSPSPGVVGARWLGCVGGGLGLGVRSLLCS